MCITPNPRAKELGIATVGDTDRYGAFEVTRTWWDSNGTLFVTVLDISDDPKSDPSQYATKDLKRARALARRCLIHPEKIRSARLVRRFTREEPQKPTLEFAVSRLDPKKAA